MRAKGHLQPFGCGNPLVHSESFPSARARYVRKRQEGYRCRKHALGCDLERGRGSASRTACRAECRRSPRSTAKHQRTGGSISVPAVFPIESRGVRRAESGCPDRGSRSPSMSPMTGSQFIPVTSIQHRTITASHRLAAKLLRQGDACASAFRSVWSDPIPIQSPSAMATRRAPPRPSYRGRVRPGDLFASRLRRYAVVERRRRGTRDAERRELLDVMLNRRGIPARPSGNDQQSISTPTWSFRSFTMRLNCRNI